MQQVTGELAAPAYRALHKLLQEHGSVVLAYDAEEDGEDKTFEVLAYGRGPGVRRVCKRKGKLDLALLAATSEEPTQTCRLCGVEKVASRMQSPTMCLDCNRTRSLRKSEDPAEQPGEKAPASVTMGATDPVGAL